jgi:hypothetical protein
MRGVETDQQTGSKDMNKLIIGFATAGLLGIAGISNAQTSGSGGTSPGPSTASPGTASPTAPASPTGTSDAPAADTSQGRSGSAADGSTRMRDGLPRDDARNTDRDSTMNRNLDAQRRVPRADRN